MQLQPSSPGHQCRLPRPPRSFARVFYLPRLHSCAAAAFTPVTQPDSRHVTDDLVHVDQIEISGVCRLLSLTMSTLPPDASVEEIEDEIIVQQTMLESLGDGSDAVRDEIERTIRELEERMASYPRDNQGEGPSEASGQFGNRLGSEDSTSSVTLSLPEIPGAFPSSSQTGPQYGGLHQNANSWTGTQQPSQSQFLSSKRPFQPSDSLDDTNYDRFKRPTPDISRSQTPSSMVSQAQIVDAQRREKQRQEWERVRIKRETEAADARMAAHLSLYNQSSSPDLSAGPSRPTPRSAVAANNTSPSNWHGIFRPPSYNRLRETAPPQSPTPSPRVPMSNDYNGLGSYSAPGRSALHSHNYSLPPMRQMVKSEGHHQLSQSATQSPASTAYVDLTGSDDDTEVIDLTRPRPHIPGAYVHDYTANQNRGNAMNPSVTDAQREAMLYNRQLQAGYGSAYPIHSRPPNPPATGYPSLAYTYTNPNIRAVHAAADRWNNDMIQIGNLVNGSALTPEMAAWQRAAAYDPREEMNADPEETREELRKLMETIGHDEGGEEEGETDGPEPDHVIAGMTVKLKPYQYTGLKWLQKMESGNTRGGILADDMGLGKTVQAISLMVSNRSEESANKTTLIVAPVALLRQWCEEIRDKIRRGPHSLTVFLHHGSAKKKNHKALREFDVVLTTFGTLAAESKRWEKYLARKHHDPEARPRADETCLFVGPECKWYRVIIDEAQCIKNRNTRAAKAASILNSSYRFCLTGTPMMNGVEELYSLIKFLRIKPYSDWTKFNLDFVRPMKGTSEEGRAIAMRKLQVMLKATLLRRNKQTKINGRPILVLPERVIEQTHAVFSEDEQTLYTALETKQQVQFNKYLKAGTVGRSYAHILLLLLRLRQACCHPHLIRDFGVAAVADIPKDDMDDLCRSLSDVVVARIKEQDGNFECPVCFDAVENPAIFVPCGHKTCTECFTRIAEPGTALAEGEETGSGRSSKCPECRNPINTKSIVDYTCFKRIHMGDPDAAVEEDPAEEDITLEMDSDADSDDTDNDSEDDNENDGTLNGFIVKDDSDSHTEAGSEPDEDDKSNIIPGTSKEIQRRRADGRLEDQSQASSSALTKPKDKKPKKSKKARGKQRAGKKSTLTLPELKKLAGTSASHKRAYMEKVGKDYIPSAKIEKTMEIIRSIMDAEEDPEKIIIFSQWTSLLDLLEIDIDRHKFGYRRYDGSMNAKARGDAVDDFKTKPNVRMMLVSLKAGNAGLNLNIASQVIILDPFWNPYIEEQAIDRAHRLGQTRPVKVHRVLVAETVEDRILALQEKKRAVISEALDEKASQGVSRLSPRELAYLFGINRNLHDPLVVPARAPAGHM